MNETLPVSPLAPPQVTLIGSEKRAMSRAMSNEARQPFANRDVQALNRLVPCDLLVHLYFQNVH